MKKLLIAMAIMTTASSAFAKLSPASENCNMRKNYGILSPTNPPKAPKVQTADAQGAKKAVR